MRTKFGYSVIEVLLAGSILALVVTGVVISILFSQRANQASLAQQQALLMVNDGFEILRSMRNRDYAWLVNGSNMALVFNNNQWNLVLSPAPGDDVIDNRVRRITIADGSNPNQKLVTVNVSYPINPEGDLKSVQKTEIIANLFATNPSRVRATSDNYQLIDDLVGEYQHVFTSP